jgi:hypothetical protein
MKEDGVDEAALIKKSLLVPCKMKIFSWKAKKNESMRGDNDTNVF